MPSRLVPIESVIWPLVAVVPTGPNAIVGGCTTWALSVTVPMLSTPAEKVPLTAEPLRARNSSPCRNENALIDASANDAGSMVDTERKSPGLTTSPATVALSALR